MKAPPGHSGLQSVAATVTADLTEAIESLATDLLGRPEFRTRSELRWGARARVRVTIAGPHRGRFTDFGSGECLSVYADNDPTGLSAAEACAERWRAAGREARVLVPDEPGTDFADLLQGRAA